MGAGCLFCTELGEGQETLLAQILSDYTDQHQTNDSQEVNSKRTITIKFPVKTEF